MKDKIPLETFQVEEVEVKAYQWLTQEEEDQFNIILSGDQEYSESDAPKTKYSHVIAAKNYRLKCLLVNPTFEELNILPPKVRDAIANKVQELIDKKK